MSQFRMTNIWPGVPLPVPPVPVVGVGLRLGPEGTNEPHTMWLMLRGAETEYRPVPDELVIRELVQLDCSDAEAVLDFIREYGIISRSAADSGLHRRARPAVKLNSWDVSVEDVQIHLFEVQCMAKHFIAIRRGESPVSAWAGLQEMETDEWASAVFVARLNNGLRWCHVRLEAEFGDEGLTPDEIGKPTPGLYSALCLQLYNLVLDDEAELHTCPSCLQAFVHQRGRAQSRQFRSTGVTYCSKKCANREAARAHRARATIERTRQQ